MLHFGNLSELNFDINLVVIHDVGPVFTADWVGWGLTWLEIRSLPSKSFDHSGKNARL